MDESARRKLAYAIARARGLTPSTIYGHHTGEHTHMSGSGSSYYDHSSGDYFSSTYDFGSGSHWNFSLNGSNFTGYNFGSGDHFSGSVSGRNITFYDYGSGEWYHYLAQPIVAGREPHSGNINQCQTANDGGAEAKGAEDGVHEGGRISG